VTRQTTISLSWIAEHLSIRSAASASQQIRPQPKVAKGGPSATNEVEDIEKN